MNVRPLPIKSPMIMVLFLIGYGFLFTTQNQHTSTASPNISPTIPVPVLDVLGHNYMNQLIAEILFIKAAVYFGGLNKQPDKDNLEMMQQHFTAMSQLHPRLLDIYYRSESVLAHRGKSFVHATNAILEKGRVALPDQIVLPFFEGFNYFHYLNKPIKAGETLRVASNIPGSPPWIGHLASMLMASGGNIRTGLIWLKGMLAASQDEDEKRRYRQDIDAFEKAMQVQRALEHYAHKHGVYPENLSALFANELRELPTWEGNYVLEYQAPTLFLRRKTHD